MKSRRFAMLVLSMLTVAPAPRDRHGDALPDGALARLGTIRQRVPASQIAISADGRDIVTVAAGRAIVRWDAASGRMRQHRLLPGKPTNQFWLSTDGRLLAVSEEKGLAVFDTETGTRKHLLTVSAMRVAFRPDGKMLATFEPRKSHRRIRLWNLDTGKDRLLAEVASDVNAFAFSPDGKRLFAAIDDPSLRCWNLDDGKQVWESNHSALHLAVSPDGRILCSDRSNSSDLRLWNAGTGRQIGGIPTRKTLGIGRLAFAADGRTGFAADYKDVLLWDIATGKVRRRLAGAGSCFAVAPRRQDAGQHHRRAFAALGRGNRQTALSRYV